MSKGDGMSFAEFTYPLMQAWDWWHMYHRKGIHMQIGGSDQFGNITAGIDAIKYISKNHPMPEVVEKIKGMGDPFGFTVPLLTTGGKKFGKSEGNAIWLDAEQTSTFDLYGFLLRTPDDVVGSYLKMFTFLSIEKINVLIEEHLLNPSARKAQHMLARELVELVHGPHEAKVAEEQHRLLFQKKPEETSTLEVAVDPDTAVGYTTLNNRPKINVQLPASVINSLSIARIVYAAGLTASANEAHHLIQNDGIRIGGMAGSKDKLAEPGFVTWSKVSAWPNQETAKWLIGDDLLMLKRGKHNIRVIQVVPDEEYSASGRTYPGQKIRNGPLSNLELRNKKVLENLQGAKGHEDLLED
jgi:tyrosyl-tRNA synthetase